MNKVVHFPQTDVPKGCLKIRNLRFSVIQSDDNKRFKRSENSLQTLKLTVVKLLQ